MIYETGLQLLDKYIAEQHGGNLSSAARALGVKLHALRKWKERISVPNSKDLGMILDTIGAKLVLRDEDQSREVCFVDAKIVPAGRAAPPPSDADYIAVPLVSEAGAGPGIVPEDELKSWVLVYRNLRSIARRSNLIAVEVGKHSRSMVPLLHPGDIVLVDLDDKGEVSGFSPPGNTYLVREPGQDGGGKIKRVSLNGKGSNTIVTYYSENVAENEPEPYFLKQDFDDDLTKAIVGKVVWAWTDLSRK